MIFEELTPQNLLVWLWKLDIINPHMPILIDKKIRLSIWFYYKIFDLRGKIDILGGVIHSELGLIGFLFLVIFISIFLFKLDEVYFVYWCHHCIEGPIMVAVWPTSKYLFKYLWVSSKQLPSSLGAFNEMVCWSLWSNTKFVTWLCRYILGSIWAVLDLKWSCICGEPTVFILHSLSWISTKCISNSPLSSKIVLI